MVDNSRIRPYMDTRIVILIERLSEIHSLSLGKILTIILNDSPLFKNLLDNYYADEKVLKNLFLGLLSDERKCKNTEYKNKGEYMENEAVEVGNIDGFCFGAELKGVYGVLKGTSQYTEITQIFSDESDGSLLFYDRYNPDEVKIEFIGSKEAVLEYLLGKEVERNNDKEELNK